MNDHLIVSSTSILFCGGDFSLCRVVFVAQWQGEAICFMSGCCMKIQQYRSILVPLHQHRRQIDALIVSSASILSCGGDFTLCRVVLAAASILEQQFPICYWWWVQQNLTIICVVSLLFPCYYLYRIADYNEKQTIQSSASWPCPGPIDDQPASVPALHLAVLICHLPPTIH